MSAVKERLRILKMIEDGVITADEGARLLAAVEEPAPRRESAPGAAVPPRWFRVRVTDLDSGTAKVNVSIPLGLVDVGLRMGARFRPELGGYELNSIKQAIRQGLQGKIFEAEDRQDGERVEIYVE
jgi:hypothetical protein